MQKIIIKAGVVSGLLMALTMAVTFPLLNALGANNAEMLVYALKILSFVPILLIIRAYRDNECEGFLSFGRGVSMAMISAFIAILFYVATWLIIYYYFPAQIDALNQQVLAQIKSSGKSQKEINDAIEQLNSIKQHMADPLANGGQTFASQLPLALIFSLLTGLILKKQKASPNLS